MEHGAQGARAHSARARRGTSLHHGMGMLQAHARCRRLTSRRRMALWLKSLSARSIVREKRPAE
eukprot:15480199-Alexandrium_andersonii.AAC.1